MANRDPHAETVARALIEVLVAHILRPTTLLSASQVQILIALLGVLERQGALDAIYPAMPAPEPVAPELMAWLEAPSASSFH